MLLNEWISKNLGKYVRYNRTTKDYQCVDLAKSNLVEVHDFYEKYPNLKRSWAWGNARQWYEQFNSHKELKENFERIPNSAKFVPIAGDICVFTEFNKYGHICVAYNNKSTTRKIYTVDQNYPTGSKVRYCTHKYNSEGFLGVLRPIRTVRAAVNVRNRPSTSSDIVGELKTGTRVKIIELDSTGKWAKIGTNKWISYFYVNKI